MSERARLGMIRVELDGEELATASTVSAVEEFSKVPFIRMLIPRYLHRPVNEHFSKVL